MKKYFRFINYFSQTIKIYLSLASVCATLSMGGMIAILTKLDNAVLEVATMAASISAIVFIAMAFINFIGTTYTYFEKVR